MTDTTQEAAATQPSNPAEVAETSTKTTAPVEQENSTDPAAGEAAQQAESKTEKPAASEDDPGTEPAEEGQPKKSKGGFQNRIDKLTRERYEAEIRAEQAERKLTELNRQLRPDLNAEPGPEPKLEEFADFGEFVKARDEWVARSVYQKANAEQVAQRKHQEQVAAQAALNARIAETRAKTPDFDQVVGPIAQFVDSNPTLNAYALESELSHEVFYHLAKSNPGRLLELARMSPTRAQVELGRLEANLKAPAPPKPVTNAPPPMRPVGSSEKAPVSLETADMDAYIRMRREQDRKRKG